MKQPNKGGRPKLAQQEASNKTSLEMLKLHQEGMTLYALGDLYGLSFTSVYDRIKRARRGLCG